MKTHAPLVAAILGLLAFSGCTADDDERPDYDPGVTAADFVAGGITNPYLPYKRGASWVYEMETDEGTERIEVRVLDSTKTVLGIQATVVRDTVRVDGELKEDTYDWYAQDRQGNVWYLGEDTKEYEGGQVVSTEGSWEWGEDRALAGIAMKANPTVDGQAYFQEFYWEEAVDEAQVIALGRRVVVPAGTYMDTVTIKEWTRLDPDVEENKNYARGIGLVMEEVTKGDNVGAKEELVSYEMP